MRCIVGRLSLQLIGLVVIDAAAATRERSSRN
jgi:hypothetical protein